MGGFGGGSAPPGYSPGNLLSLPITSSWSREPINSSYLLLPITSYYYIFQEHQACHDSPRGSLFFSRSLRAVHGFLLAQQRPGTVDREGGLPRRLGHVNTGLPANEGLSRGPGEHREPCNGRPGRRPGRLPDVRSEVLRS